MANDDDSSVPQPRGPPPGATAPPDHVTKPQVYEIFESSKSEARDVNNPTSNSPGKQGQYVRPTMSDGISSIKSDDFLKVHQMPCARQGLLTGIGSGFVMGFIRYLTGGKSQKTIFRGNAPAPYNLLTVVFCSTGAESRQLGCRRIHSGQHCSMGSLPVPAGPGAGSHGQGCGSH